MLKKIFTRLSAGSNPLARESATAAAEGENLFTFVGEDGREHALYARFLPNERRQAEVSAKYLVSKYVVKPAGSDVVLMGCDRQFSQDQFVFEDESGQKVNFIKNLCFQV